MSAGDGTGPLGMGPKTGRAAGFCAGLGMPGYANLIPRRWPAVRCGWLAGDRRWRHWYYATGLPGWARFGWAPAWGTPPASAYGPTASPTREQEAELLKSQAEWLKQRLEAIQQRLTELEKEA